MLGNLRNPKRVDEGERRRRLREAEPHVQCCAKLYRHHLRNGLYFLHEHPASATSWTVPCIEGTKQRPVVQCVGRHMCAFGIVAKHDDGTAGPVKKPTQFISNSLPILGYVHRECQGCGGHAHLLSGRAARAAEYPKALCWAVCKGVGGHRWNWTALG